jgi:hypothetical protein
MALLLTLIRLMFPWIEQGLLTEGEGSVHLTSSLGNLISEKNIITIFNKKGANVVTVTLL